MLLWFLIPPYKLFFSKHFAILVLQNFRDMRPSIPYNIAEDALFTLHAKALGS